MLDRFDYAALGHIHLHQRIGDYPAYYSGSLNKLRFSEAEDDKYFLDVELDGGEPRVSRIPVEMLNMYFYRLELDRFSSPQEVVEHVLRGMESLEGAMVSLEGPGVSGGGEEGVARLRLGRIRVRNFGLYMDEDLDISGLDHPLLVLGSNGAGKTTFFVDALTYGAMGTAYGRERGVKRLVRRYHLERTAPEAHASVELLSDDGTVFIFLPPTDIYR